MNRSNVSWLLAVALGSPVHAAELTLPREGWASWQVEAVEDAPVWCCGVTKPCRLDEERASFGNRDAATTDSVRVYARMANGKVERIRALAASCPVETATPIVDLGTIAAGDSARWLIGLTRPSAGGGSKDLHENALAALAIHRGELALDSLAAMARGDERADMRANSVFWLAVLRGLAGAKVATSLMFNDPDPQLRQHAAFAVSESKSPSAAQDLAQLGNTDRNGEVRAQAWFWLAQMGASNAEQAIGAALENEKDDHVGEQAVFALSQLPDERATRALIAAAENPSLSNEQRKRAVFWLAQSDSPAALAWLDQVLAGNRTD